MGNGKRNRHVNSPFSLFPFPFFRFLGDRELGEHCYLSIGVALRRLTCRTRIDPFFSITTGAEAPRLAKKPNYDFEKRKKELERKAKTDAKREEKRRRREDSADDREDSAPAGSGGATPQE